MNVQGVFQPLAIWTSECLSTTSSMDVQGVVAPPALWTSGMDVQGAFSPPAVRMCWVSFHHPKYGRAGCLSNTSSMDVQGVFPPPSVWTHRVSFHYQQCGVQAFFPPPAVLTFRVSFHNQQYGRAGCFHPQQYGRKCFFPPHGAWTCTCRVYAFPQTYSSCKCRNAGLSGIRLVWLQNGIECRWRNQSDTGCRNDDAVGITLDSNAQLWQKPVLCVCAED
jgi:hypothetical protein